MIQNIRMVYYKLCDITNEMTYLLSIVLTAAWGLIVGIMIAFSLDKHDEVEK